MIKIRLYHQKKAYYEKVRIESERKMAELEQEYLQKELRNKLNLEHDQNLIEYLLNV